MVLSTNLGVSLPSITHHIPWISKFMRYFPVVNGSMTRFIEFGMEKALTRYTMEMKRKDLFYHMVRLEVIRLIGKASWRFIR